MKIAVFYENIYGGAKAAGKDMAETLQLLKDAGMELIYLSADSLRRDKNWLMPLLAKLGLGIEGVHAFCDFAGDPETPLCEETIHLAKECGAGNLLFVPGMLTGKNTLKDFSNIALGIRRAVQLGQSMGLPVLMEDYDGLTAPYNSILSLKWFLDNTDGLGCAFDTGNFIIFHEDELEALDLFRDRIVTLHMKDRAIDRRHPGDHACACADGKQLYSCATGSGFIRMAEILKRLKTTGYTGNVVAELYGCDLAFMLEDIFSSVAFLKRQIES